MLHLKGLNFEAFLFSEYKSKKWIEGRGQFLVLSHQQTNGENYV